MVLTIFPSVCLALPPVSPETGRSLRPVRTRGRSPHWSGGTGQASAAY